MNPYIWILDNFSNSDMHKIEIVDLNDCLEVKSILRQSRPETFFRRQACTQNEQNW